MNMTTLATASNDLKTWDGQEQTICTVTVGNEAQGGGCTPCCNTFGMALDFIPTVEDPCQRGGFDLLESDTRVVLLNDTGVLSIQKGHMLHVYPAAVFMLDGEYPGTVTGIYAALPGSSVYSEMSLGFAKERAQAMGLYGLAKDALTKFGVSVKYGRPRSHSATKTASAGASPRHGDSAMPGGIVFFAPLGELAVEPGQPVYLMLSCAWDDEDDEEWVVEATVGQGGTKTLLAQSKSIDEARGTLHDLIAQFERSQVDFYADEVNW